MTQQLRRTLRLDLQALGYRLEGPLNAALRIHRRKRLAARLGAILGLLFLVVAVAAFLCSLHSPCKALVFLVGLAWGLWGAHFLATRH